MSMARRDGPSLRYVQRRRPRQTVPMPARCRATQSRPAVISVLAVMVEPRFVLARSKMRAKANSTAARIANTGASGGRADASGHTPDALRLVSGEDGTVLDMVVVAAPAWTVPGIKVVGAVLGTLLVVAAIRAMFGKRDGK